MRMTLLAGLALCPIMLFADIAGTYRATGFDPDSGPYSGRVEITQSSDAVYSIDWSLDDGRTYEGTGVQQGRHLSFVYEGRDGSGVQSYIIRCCNGQSILQGPFVALHGKAEGRERLTPD